MGGPPTMLSGGEEFHIRARSMFGKRKRRKEGLERFVKSVSCRKLTQQFSVTE